MAIFTGVLRKMTGSLGDMTFRDLNGQTVVSEKVVKMPNPRTVKQMRRRAQWLNVMAFGQLINEFNHPAFESKPRTMSDINAFVQANIGVVPVYITKGEKLQGGCVVAGYQVTRGSLPAINHGQGTGDVVITDISLGSMSITASTTLKAFSNAVVNNNTGYQYGDQISCYIFTQSVNAATNVPYVTMQALEVTLDANDEETYLRDLVGPEAFSVVDNKLGAGQTVNGGIVYVHSRKNASGKTLVSTQNVVVSNTILETYQSNAQAEVSMESLGWEQKDEPFLTPNVNDVVEPVTP